MTSDLKSLRQVIAEKGAEYAYEEIDSEHLIGLVNEEARVIRAILDRTAVVHPFNDSSPNVRSVVALHKVMVWPRDIKWRKRPTIGDSPWSRTRKDGS